MDEIKLFKKNDLSYDKKIAFRIVGIYFLISTLWFFLWENIIDFFTLGVSKKIISFLTNGVFFTVTACMLYFIVYKNIQIIRSLQKKVDVYEENYKLVINNTTEGLWDWNVLTEEVVLPTKWKKTLGYEEDEIPNTVEAWIKLIHQEDLDWVTDAFVEYLDQKVPEYNVEYRLVKKDGGVIWIHDKGHALWDEEGMPIRVCGTHTDITYRKEAEKEILRMMEEKQELLAKTLQHERLQSEFFSNISHEFKTPLNVILGTVQLMEFYKNTQSQLEPQQLEKSIRIMKQNCYRLLRLINNLLDTTKLDFNAFNLKLENYNIIHIIEEITQSTVVLAQNKGISIIFDTDVEEKVIACDINIIERIMLNLLSNAIKYTEQGGEIFVMLSDLGENILISVKDTGIGIPKDKADIIFDRFIQIDGSLQRRAEGSGIGLSLVKNFVEKLEGEIWVESKPNEGSEFSIKLPAKELVDGNIHLNSDDYIKNLTEKINVELSDIYAINN